MVDCVFIKFGNYHVKKSILHLLGCIFVCEVETYMIRLLMVRWVFIKSDFTFTSLFFFLVYESRRSYSLSWDEFQQQLFCHVYISVRLKNLLVSTYRKKKKLSNHVCHVIIQCVPCCQTVLSATLIFNCPYKLLVLWHSYYAWSDNITWKTIFMLSNYKPDRIDKTSFCQKALYWQLWNFTLNKCIISSTFCYW